MNSKSSMQETTVDILRHGACEGGEIFRGSTDVPLSDEGWRQMHAAIEIEQDWQQIISSPLQRCRRFAEKLSLELGCPLQVEDDWREIHFGVWEGQAISDVWENDTATVSQYMDDPGSITPEDGEALSDACRRLTSAWQKALAEHRGKKILIVQHGGTMRLLLSIVLGFPLRNINRFHIPYASTSRIKIYHGPEKDYPVVLNMNPHIKLEISPQVSAND